MAEPMTPEEITTHVIAWQTNPHVKHLTCGHDSTHPDLEPRTENHKVVLVCVGPNCRYRQTLIPYTVLRFPIPTPVASDQPIAPLLP